MTDGDTMDQRVNDSNANRALEQIQSRNTHKSTGSYVEPTPIANLGSNGQVFHSFNPMLTNYNANGLNGDPPGTN